MDDSQIKVLMLTSRFEVRGSSAYTLRLAENLSAHNIEARIACVDASRIEHVRRSKLEIHEYPYLKLPVLGLLTRSLVLRENLDWSPDLIHVQSTEMISAGEWLARRLECPCVLTVHQVLPRKYRLHFVPSADHLLIAVSSPVKIVLMDRLGISPEQVRVIHNGVEADPTSALKLPPVLDPDHRPVVGVAGPLESIKGLPFFLGAAKRVLAVRPDVEFLVCGAGPEETNLRRLSKDLEIAGQVAFVPNVTDFAEPLAAMDIFCLPSLQQGLGTIMLEAMAHGKPVIASGVGGVFSVIRDNETGLVVPPSNSEQLAERILELLNDPVRARAIGQAGRRMVREEFSCDDMVTETAAIYREAVSAKSQSPAVIAKTS